MHYLFLEKVKIIWLLRFLLKIESLIKKEMKVNIIRGDLLDATEDYIVHQCNCVTNTSKFVAQQIFYKYPYSNTYKTRSSKKITHSIPGTIDILGNGHNERYVINIYSQLYPTVAKYSNDSIKLREQWFKKCLDLIGQELNKNKTIAMPYKIGCGSAGGDWTTYLNMISEFSDKYDISVTLYQLDLDQV